MQRQNRLKVFLKRMIIWFWVQKDPEIIINGYNAEIKAVRYAQITDDGKDTRNSLHYRQMRERGSEHIARDQGKLRGE